MLSKTGGGCSYWAGRLVHWWPVTQRRTFVQGWSTWMALVVIATAVVFYLAWFGPAAHHVAGPLPIITREATGRPASWSCPGLRLEAHLGSRSGIDGKY
jgi:hypothetical protein